MPRPISVLLLLALTQITGWGSISLLPVIAPEIAAEYGADLPSVFTGTSLFYASMGLTAPLAGRAIRRFGARDIMAAGAGMIGIALALLAVALNLAIFSIAWMIAGCGGAMFLTTSAYAYLAAFAPEKARSMIGTLMLATGLAGSVFWPLTAFLSHAIGWRGGVFVYAGVLLLVVCPVIRFALPTMAATAASTSTDRSRGGGRIFPLLVSAIALNSFVTFGIEAVGIQLLQAAGMDGTRAIAIAALLGIFKVGGRLVDLSGGTRWDGLSTGLVAGAMIPLGLAAVWIGGAGMLSVGGYLILFGIGSGAFAVARATMPLVFFDKADYAAAMARIALPMNLINAFAPPVLAGLMTGIGAQGTFACLGMLSVAAFLLLLRLNGLRARPAAA